MIPAKRDVCLVLDSLRSVHNAGSVFRTAETLGISKIYCAGTTPSPVDRFARPRPDFVKVSLGAENSVSWECASNAATLVRRLKKEGYYIIALEQATSSIDYKKFKPAKSKKVAVILGNEVDGVSPMLLKLADAIAEIPMRGAKESLNVSVAAGVALFRWFDR